MRTLIRQLASIKIGVAVLVALIVALAAGTIVESTHGRDAAMARVYMTWWFYLLLAALAVNVAASLADRFPWRRHQVGYVMTHSAMLLVLIGSVATLTLKDEGVLALWEGEEAASYERLEQGRPVREPLPFSVRLESFEIDYYQGTRRPAMYRSRVVVTDPAAGGSFRADIEMNKELSHAGYRLFQSSYKIEGGREMTVLSVARDPGQPVVFAGYVLLVAGMLTTLGRRIAAARGALPVSAEEERPVGAKRRARRTAAALVVLSVAGGTSSWALAAQLPDPAAVARLRSLPVQHDGRVMPLDTVAREAVREVTGRHAWNGVDSVALVLGWSFAPDAWADEPLLPVDPETALALAVPIQDGRASFHGVVGSPRALAAFQRAHAQSAAERPLTPVDKAALEIEGRLIAMQPFLTHEAYRVLPNPHDPQAAWAVPPGLRGPGDLEAVASRTGAVADASNIDTEILYNRVRPSRLAWWILGPATLISLAAWNRRSRWLDAFALLGLAAGFAVMTWGISARWTIAGRIPASNMYESLLFLGWGVGLFALVAFVFLRNRLVVLNATAMSALTMALTDLLPIDPFVHPMPPVLSGTPWLAIHVPIIMVSYSVLALGVLIAHMQIGIGIFAPARRDLVERMHDLLYWYIHIGSILLIAGILTGSIWAASSWGRYWGWDPKEVWSLIAFLAYTAILHGRLDRFIGKFGVAALSIVAFWTILMTYIGVNYVLAAGLHSYGFGGSGVVRWMAFLAVAETAFLVTGYVARRRSAPLAAAAA